MYMYLLPLGKFYIFKLKSTILQVDIKIDLYFKVIFSFNEENRDRCVFLLVDFEISIFRIYLEFSSTEKSRQELGD